MSDPVADFLAREQNMFADFDGAPPQEAPAVAQDPVDDLADDFGDLQAAENPAAAAPVQIAPIDSGVDLDGLVAEADAENNAPILNGAAQNGTGSISSGPSPVFPRIEAEKIRVWKENQQRVLEQKDAAEEKRKEELKAQARKELDDWYKQREQTLKLAHSENLKNEQSTQELFAKQQDGEAQWESVNKLVEQQKSKLRFHLSSPQHCSHHIFQISLLFV
ncbi:unnamed protein product [Caenorhabditis angaria]|uniref:Clathrin light chain n=1 Tax=Caenorhabditis angaria TaxID=860376 RepID=A0A9P1IRL7_9PELO|nr:unnamed protein product [Caenorhabditis angaria]